MKDLEMDNCDAYAYSPCEPMSEFVQSLKLINLEMDNCDAYSYSPCEPMNEWMQSLKLIIKYNDFAKKCAFNNTVPQCRDSTQSLTAGGAFMIYFFSFFLLMGVVATVLSHLSDRHAGNKRPKTGWRHRCSSFLKCFCLLTNFKEMMLPTKFPFLNGIRCLSEFLVITSHALIGVVTIAEKTDNFLYFRDTLFFRITFLSGFYTMSSFFCISGFLNGYSFFRDAARNTPKSWFQFYTNRLIRLTPLYTVALVFYVTVFPSLFNGPLWSTYPAEAICKAHWLKNLLYVNNLGSIQEMCITWSWFLTVDMQLYVVSPLLLITLWRWPRFGYLLAAFFVLGSASITALLTFYFFQSAFVASLLQFFSADESEILSLEERLTVGFETIYTRPYMWFSAYVLGITLAHFTQNRSNNKVIVNKSTLYVGWTVSATLLYLCLFGVDQASPSLLEVCISNALSHVCFACVTAWIIFVCINGHGGYLNMVLSHRIFIPLNNINYALYLTHMFILIANGAAQRELMEYSFLKQLPVFVGLLVVMYTTAFILTLTIQWPIDKIIHLVSSKPKWRKVT